MIFLLDFNTDNAAFQGDDPDMAQESIRAECARILRDIADALESGRDKGRCVDLNGNTVGDWGFGQ